MQNIQCKRSSCSHVYSFSVADEAIFSPLHFLPKDSHIEKALIQKGNELQILLWFLDLLFYILMVIGGKDLL